MINILIASRYGNDQKRILDALPEHMDFIITGVVKDETGAIIKSEHLKPNILLVDLQLSELSGPDLVRVIRRKSPATAIIILQDGVFSRSAADMVSFINGISGFLLKESDFDKLALIIKIVFLGGSYINTSVKNGIFNSITLIDRFPMQIENDIFSSVERNIVVFIARGLSDPEIAVELNISVGTIRNCITEIRQKINLKSRVEIVIYFLFSGLIRMENLWIWKNI